MIRDVTRMQLVKCDRLVRAANGHRLFHPPQPPPPPPRVWSRLWEVKPPAAPLGCLMLEIRAGGGAGTIGCGGFTIMSCHIQSSHHQITSKNLWNTTFLKIQSSPPVLSVGLVARYWSFLEENKKKNVSDSIENCHHLTLWDGVAHRRLFFISSLSDSFSPLCIDLQRYPADGSSSVRPFCVLHLLSIIHHSLCSFCRCSNTPHLQTIIVQFLNVWNNDASAVALSLK